MTTRTMTVESGDREGDVVRVSDREHVRLVRKLADRLAEVVRVVGVLRRDSDGPWTEWVAEAA